VNKQWSSKEVKAFRAVLELSQRDFGKLLGVTEQHIYYIERGVREPSQILRLLLDCIEEKQNKREDNKS